MSFTICCIGLNKTGMQKLQFHSNFLDMVRYKKDQNIIRYNIVSLLSLSYRVTIIFYIKFILISIERSQYLKAVNNKIFPSRGIPFVISVLHLFQNKTHQLFT